MREELRKKIVNLYGKDLDKASTRQSGNSFSIIFEDENTTIRFVGIRDKKERLAKMMWADDLKLFKDTICEPMPSVNGNLIEEFTINDRRYACSKFKLPRGRMIKPKEITPMYLICAGDLLGNIHKASMDQEMEGMKYKIEPLAQSYFNDENKKRYMLSPEMEKKVKRLYYTLSDMSRASDVYGVCYGDYDINNQFVDANNIYLFNFESCFYAHYMFDIACFFYSILYNGYMPELPSKEVVEKYLLPWFRIGYSINKKCESAYWDDLEFFLSVKAVVELLDFYNPSKEIGEDFDQRSYRKAKCSAIFNSDSFYEGMDRAREMKKGNVGDGHCE